MQQSILALSLLTTILLASCASNWVGVDGSRVNAAKVAQASNVCMVAEKMRMLRTTRKFTDLMAASSNPKARQLTEAFDQFAQRVNADIANCMRAQGLIAS